MSVYLHTHTEGSRRDKGKKSKQNMKGSDCVDFMQRRRLSACGPGDGRGQVGELEFVSVYLHTQWRQVEGMKVKQKKKKKCRERWSAWC